ncbi:hypothetical protein HY384_00850 [Candidatus Daviesbacteria bacterium]|nr:hypothetical protein [Candidatus Daviesbacteria bacterium]
MKYDSMLSELKNIIPNTKSILIALPPNPSIDNLASSLALFLTFEGSGKEVTVVCQTDITVGQAHLFGVDQIQKNLPPGGGGNLTLTLEGVAASDNTVPALEKLDWYAENNNLNLVFHVLPGQTFQPAKIVPKYQGSGFNLIFVVGVVNLNVLGDYSINPQLFSGSHIVNIDIQASNTNFGQTNIVDNNSSSLSEVMSYLIADLGFTLDGDCASNLLAGIFDATANLSGSKVSADTFMAVANCLRVGGRKPVGVVTPATPPFSQPSTQAAYDWNAVSAALGQSITPQLSGISDFAVPPVVSSSSQPVADAGDHETVYKQTPKPSPEERPLVEGVVSETVEPEWLTPKIFKGSSLG